MKVGLIVAVLVGLIMFTAFIAGDTFEDDKVTLESTFISKALNSDTLWIPGHCRIYYDESFSAINDYIVSCLTNEESRDECTYRAVVLICTRVKCNL